MNDRIELMRIFSRVVDAGSFSGAARMLQLTQPQVSKAVAALETHLGVRLFERTTRSLSLTDEGGQLHRHVGEAITAVEIAESSVGKRAEPSGRLKLACGTVLGRSKIAPHLSAFAARYPNVHVDLVLGDHFSNLVEEGFDVAIRMGELEDSTLIARKIGQASRVCVASPAYLSRKGRPLRPEDLRGHECILLNLQATQDEWTFSHRGASSPRESVSTTVKVSGQIATNDPGAVREIVLAGGGIALSPIWLFESDLVAKRVKRLLVGHEPMPVSIHAVIPSSRFKPARVTAFIDYLAQVWAEDRVLNAR